MIIYLVRHGETLINKQSRFLGQFDIALSGHGMEQALAVSGYLKSKSVARIHSSDLSRALQTARMIAEPHGLPVVADSGLREIDFGEWEGLTYDEIAGIDGERFEAWASNYESIPIPGGESWDSFSGRVMAAFQVIVASAGKTDDDNATVIVTHGGPIRLITSRLIDDPDHFKSFWPAPGSLHMLEIDKRNNVNYYHLNQQIS